MTKSATAPYQDDVNKAFQEIETSWLSGRSIVPLIGAGISVDAGMPVVQGIERYLAMLHKCITGGVFFADSQAQDSTTASSSPRKKLHTAYQRRPDLFIEDFDWPDRFALQQQLCHWKDFWKERKADSTAAAAPAAAGANKGIPASAQRHYVRMADLINDAFKEILTPDLGWRADVLVKEKLNDGGTLQALFGNWRNLIDRFTDFGSDRADKLILGLHHHRHPAAAHLYLAFLLRMSLSRTVLTFNFDRLLEAALTSQHMAYRVFAMERGDTVPTRMLTNEDLTIVKLHGDAHRLLMDARLDRPLSQEYLKRLYDCMCGKAAGKQQPLLVVLGCGGTEERTLSILRYFQEQEEQKEAVPFAIWVHFEDEPPATLLRAMPPDKRENVDASTDLKMALRRAGIMTVKARNPGFFLMHLHNYLTTRLPSSRIPYLAHIDRPIGMATPQLKEDLTKADNLKAVTIFDDRLVEGNQLSATTASQSLAAFVNRLPPDFHPLWIDLEDCYSMVDVVGRIVEQARTVDTHLTPGVFALDTIKSSGNDAFYQSLLRHDAYPPPKNKSPFLQQDHPIIKAVVRVLRVLRRGNYCLAFDSLEAFGWAPTAHHGLLADDTEVAEGTRVFSDNHISDLFTFLRLLCQYSYRTDDPQAHTRGSIIALSVGKTCNRFGEAAGQEKWDSRVNSFLEAIKLELKQEYKLVSVRGVPPKTRLTLELGKSGPNEGKPARLAVLPRLLSSSSPGGDSPIDSLTLFRLSACRRTRTLVALRQLLEPGRPGSDFSPAPAGGQRLTRAHPVDDLLRRISEPGGGLARLAATGGWGLLDESASARQRLRQGHIWTGS